MREVLQLQCPYCESKREHETHTEIKWEVIECVTCDARLTIVRHFSANGRHIVQRNEMWAPGKVVALPADPETRNAVLNYLARQEVKRKEVKR